MKKLEELNFPDDLKYDQDHEWVRRENASVRVGISDYAQDQLGDVVFVELPEVGAKFAKGEVFGDVESVKAVAELYMPVGGEIQAVNTELADAPERVNNSPYGDGWMILVRPADPAQIDALMDRDAYLAKLKG